MFEIRLKEGLEWLSNATDSNDSISQEAFQQTIDLGKEIGRKLENIFPNEKLVLKCEEINVKFNDLNTFIQKRQVTFSPLK